MPPRWREVGEYGDNAVHETGAHVRAGCLGAPHLAEPLLMIVASHDTITLTDLALASYERALEPKKLVLIPGGHFDPYRGQFPVAEAAATEWFCEHLVVPDVSNA
jgi:fermentation-respiration switch protein FrsA (DUF1100 family)